MDNVINVVIIVLNVKNQIFVNIVMQNSLQIKIINALNVKQDVVIAEMFKIVFVVKMVIDYKMVLASK